MRLHTSLTELTKQALQQVSKSGVSQQVSNKLQHDTAHADEALRVIQQASAG